MVITKYSLTLPISKLIWISLGLFGLSKRPMRDPWEPQTSICQSVCVFLVSICIFQAICGLNHLDLSGYNKIYELLEMWLLAVLGAYEQSFH